MINAQSMLKLALKRRIRMCGEYLERIAQLEAKLAASTSLRDTLLAENERIGGVEVNLIEAVADGLQAENERLQASLAENWVPVANWLEYDVICAAMYAGKLPDGYAICERRSPAQGKPTP